MRFRPACVLTSAILVAIGLPNALRAQTTASGGLTGVVTDQSKAVIPDAVVELRDDAIGISKSTKTDREGMYRFFFVAPAEYRLTVAHEGFGRDQRTVSVLLGPPGTVNIILRVANTKSEINVTGETPLIQAENGDASTNVNQEQISEVPNPGNDLTYIAQTTPGAVMSSDTQGFANFSILGMPGTSYLFTINGMSDNDNGTNVNLVGSSLNLLLGQNQVREATVVINGYSGQFGGAAGANINYITKSGANHFHGNAEYYWNGRALNANDWMLNATSQPRPFDNAHQWAGSFGGPIKKDKLFFFFDHEGIRVLLPQVQFVVLPSEAFESDTINNIDADPRFGPASATDSFYKRIFGLYDAAPGVGSASPGNFNPQDLTGCTGFVGPKTPQGQLGIDLPCAVHYVVTRGLPSTDTLTSGRADLNATKNDRAFVQVQYDRSLGPQSLDPIDSTFDLVTEQPWWQSELIETHTFGSSSASQFLLGGNYLSPIFKLRNTAQALAAFPTALNFASNTFTTLANGNVLASPYGISYTQYQVSEDVDITRRNHKLGFGARFRRTYWTQLVSPLSSGMLTAQTLDAFYQGGVDVGVLTGMDPNPDFTQLAQSFAHENSVRLRFYNLGLYGQDEWHARPNLSLTVALRGEHESNPLCPRGCFARMHGPFDSVSHDPNQPYDDAILTNQQRAFIDVDEVLWSPRLSFAWQPFGILRNTVLRGGVGVFYDPMPGSAAASLYQNPPLLNSYTVSHDNLTPDEMSSLFKDVKTSNDAFNYGFAHGQTLAQIQKTISTSYALGFTPPAITVPEKRTHAPQYQKWSLELQQAFGAGTTISLGYFAHHGIHELVLNNSANAYCNPAASLLPNGISNPCFGFTSSLPMTVPDARFSEVTKIASTAVSNYNGMVVSLRHRFSGWTQGLFQANYTYGHAFDEVSNGGLFSFTNGSSLTPQDPNNLQGAYGSADYDVRHSFNAIYVWEIPLKALLRERVHNSLVKGWQISGTVLARTGFPYTVFDRLESSNLGPNNNYFSAIYAVPIEAMSSGNSCGAGAAIPLAPHPCLPPQLLADGITPNPNALFVQASCETGFNTGRLGPSGSCGGRTVAFAQGRNHYRGPGYFGTDFTLMKNTKLPGWENGVLGIGFQFFNLLNHPNFGRPDFNISDSGFGQIFYMAQPATTILGAGHGGDASARMIQLRAQLKF